MEILKRGIDVSNCQGLVNWDLAAPNIDFAIIKMGIGSDDVSQDDSQFARNVSECERLGIAYGLYLYSYATNLDEAESEVQHALRQISGHNPTYPIFIDMEDADSYKAKRNVSSETCIQICELFCRRISESGYKTGIYANLNWFENYLNDSRLDGYDKWVAQYYSECQYTGNYTMWQYSSDGAVDGISGRVDMDYCYVDYSGNASTEPQETSQKQSVSTSPYVATGKCAVDLCDCYETNDSDSNVLFQLAEGNCVNIFGNTENAYYHFECLHGRAYVKCENIHVDGDDNFISPQCDDNSQNNQSTNTYTVVSGDSMYGIANKFNMSFEALIALNPQIENLPCCQVAL